MKLEISRREFIRRGVIGAASLTLLAAASKKIPVGVQLYSVREQCKKDLPGTLAAIAKMGYKGVEFAGYHGKTAKELRQILDDNGLVASGSHTPYETVFSDKLSETLEFNQTIGNKFLIIPSMSGKTKQDWLNLAKLFNDLAAKLKPQGLSVGYHAHSHDFEKIEDATAWDLFAGNTASEVILQLDTGNCAEGGAEPLATLKKYPGRTWSIHIKPHGAGPESVIGEDKLDWPAIFKFCETKGGTKWFVIEHETSKDPIDALKRSYTALGQMGKV